MSDACVCSASHGHPPGIAQPLGQLHETHQLARRAHRAGVDEHRREVVGHDAAAVELLERDHGDLLVGQTEALQHRDRRVGAEVLEQRELHVGEHELVVALRDQQPTARARPKFDGAAVDDPRVAVHRDRRRAAPTRGRRTTPPRPVRRSTVAIGAQQRHRALGDRRTPGTAYTTSPCACAAATRRATISRVRGLEVVGGVVHVVERRERHAGGGQVVDRGMAQRARESVRRRQQRGARDRQEVVGTRRSEADGDDPVGTRPRA